MTTERDEERAREVMLERLHELMAELALEPEPASYGKHRIDANREGVWP